MPGGIRGISGSCAGGYDYGFIVEVGRSDQLRFVDFVGICGIQSSRPVTEEIRLAQARGVCPHGCRRARIVDLFALDDRGYVRQSIRKYVWAGEAHIDFAAPGLAVSVSPYASRFCGGVRDQLGERLPRFVAQRFENARVSRVTRRRRVSDVWCDRHMRRRVDRHQRIAKIDRLDLLARVPCEGDDDMKIAIGGDVHVGVHATNAGAAVDVLPRRNRLLDGQQIVRQLLLCCRLIVRLAGKCGVERHRRKPAGHGGEYRSTGDAHERRSNCGRCEIPNCQRDN